MAKLMPRKRTILGSVLAIGLIAGVWLGDKLPKFGSGFGLGSGGDSIIGKPNLSDSTVHAGEQKSESEAHGPKPIRTDDAPSDNVLTILVEDRHYAVWRKTRKGNGYFPEELDKLIELAQAASPDNDGVRVRIIRSESARLTAWQRLQSELVKANIPADSILLTKELLK